MNLEEIFQFEKWLEEGFMEMLSPVCHSIYGSLSAADDTSPRIIVRATVGEIVGNHEHVFENGGPDEGGHFRSVYDAYNATIEVTVVTNRVTDAKSQNHYKMIGGVRAKMQRDYAILNWNQQNPLCLNTDLREVGSARTILDDMSLDTTAISHTVVFNVKPAVWPDNFN